MLEGGQYQILEVPERVRTNRVFLVVANQPAQIGLVLMDTEVVEPEPDHLLLQLCRRVDGAQLVAADGLVRQSIAGVIEGLARLLLIRRRGERPVLRTGNQPAFTGSP